MAMAVGGTLHGPWPVGGVSGIECAPFMVEVVMVTIVMRVVVMLSSVRGNKK